MRLRWRGVCVGLDGCVISLAIVVLLMKQM